ncbi:MAG: FAD-binding oxidoreductase [Opitutales bacterium]|nr:FAD-binding oxidoreductase [Opitutales bacterium]
MGRTIIVGNGIAGCLLAWAFYQKGEPFTLIGKPVETSSSAVAAGVLNPVTGKRMAKGWMIETFLTTAMLRYRELEEAWDETFFYQLPIQRFCLSSKEVETHRKRREDPEYRDFLGPLRAPGTLAPEFRDDFGSFPIEPVGYVELPAFLEAASRFFARYDSREEGVFHYEDLHVSKKEIRYRGENIKRVIFCEGHEVRRNPYFSWLPFRPVRGEILTLRIPGLALPKAIYHHRKWILPLPDGSFRVGSTYDRGWQSTNPTEAGKEALLKGVEAMFHPDFTPELLHHRAGVRPCSQDTRPYLGQHPEYPGLFVLNGMSSKGAVYGPWAADHLADYILDQRPLEPAFDALRFGRLYRENECGG